MSEPSLAVFTPVLETKRLTMKLVNLERDAHVLAEIMNVFLSGKDGFQWDVESATRLMTNLTLSPSNCLGLKAPGPAVCFFCQIFSLAVLDSVTFDIPETVNDKVKRITLPHAVTLSNNRKSITTQ
jgi:hypothetical protein